MSKKHKQEDNFLEKWKEWQDHQYDPGYWTGGNIPPYVNENPQTKIFGRIYTIGATLTGLFYIFISAALFVGMLIILYMIIFGDMTVSEWKDSPGLTLFLAFASITFVSGLSILGFLLGVKYLKTALAKKRPQTK